jgi:hypothetical protein
VRDVTVVARAPRTSRHTVDENAAADRVPRREFASRAASETSLARANAVERVTKKVYVPPRPPPRPIGDRMVAV